MERQVKWGRPQKDKYDNTFRVSKCGRYKVVTHEMASGRNGFFNDRAYETLRLADGTRIGALNDTLEMALDVADYDNDPNWEPGPVVVERSGVMKFFVLCERYQHVTGEYALWSLVHGVCASTRRDDLIDFERESAGEQVSERKVFAATADVGAS